jgi:hypothetical protein
MFKLKKTYRKECRYAKSVYSKSIVNGLRNLNGNDSKSFWDYMKKIKIDTKGVSLDNPISPDTWHTYFKNMFSHQTEPNQFQKKIIADLKEF